MSAPVITRAGYGDCAALGDLAARTFTDTFGYLYSTENLASHLASHCSEAYFRKTLDTGEAVLVAHIDGVPVAYSKFGRVGLPVESPPVGAIEITRLYLDKSAQGQGLGRALMEYMLALPQVAAAPIVYLGVWENNLRAQRLYQRCGFVPIGEYLYYVGTHADREFIYARTR